MEAIEELALDEVHHGRRRTIGPNHELASRPSNPAKRLPNQQYHAESG